MIKYLFPLFVLCGCGNGLILPTEPIKPKDGLNAQSAAFSQSTTDTSVCTTGGSILNAGVDTNDDTVLQTIEVTTMVITCNGLNGAQGIAGVNGTNATPVTAIQLCPASFIPTYPSIFPEVAFCISNKMYGVYSANGGFMTYLPIGNYNSNGINASCNFNIQANCVVN